MVLIHSKIIYAGFIVPTVVYLALMSHLLYTHITGVNKSDKSETLSWSTSVTTEKRKEIILKRSEAILAYK